jgi:O-methyltransferase
MSKPLNEVEWTAKLSMDQCRQRCPDVRDPLFWDIYEKWRGETLIPPERLVSSYAALRTALTNGVEGAIAECGVFRGGSFCFFIDVVGELFGPTREFWAFDTFEGFPEGVEDVVLGDKTFKSEMWHTDNFYSIFTRNLARTKYPKDKIIVVKGSVLETIPAQAPDQICFLHLDTDYYESTLHELVHLYDRVSRGGAIEVDDYGHFEGCRRAVDEFLTGKVPQPMMFRSGDYTGRIILKA